MEAQVNAHGQQAAPGVTSVYTGFDLDQDNRIVVDIVAHVAKQLLQQLQAAGALVLDSQKNYRAIRAIVATDAVTAGVFPITVTNSTPGGGTSNSVTLTVQWKIIRRVARKPWMRRVRYSMARVAAELQFYDCK